MDINCWNKKLGSPMMNLSWRLYATETNPAKGPIPATLQTASTTSTSTPTSSSISSANSTSPIVVVKEKEEKKRIIMSIGAITGIVIRCILLAVLVTVVVLAFRNKLGHEIQTKEIEHQPTYQTGVGASEDPCELPV